MKRRKNRLSPEARRLYEQMGDPDWKPEMPEPVQERPTPVQTTETGPPQPFLVLAQTPFSSDQVHKGTLIIIELEYNPPRFILILDKDKELMRFPFGGMEATDATPAAGATRETREEVGIPEDVGTPISGDNESFIGEINFGNSVFYVFTKKVPTPTQIVLGEEQEEWAPVTADTIDRFAKDGLITLKHMRAWEVFKRKRWPQ